MQKKILTLLLCSALSVCAFSGCGDSNTASVDKIKNTEVEEQAIQNPQESMNSQDIDGISSVLSKMFFHDCPISFPCQFSALSEYFSLGNGFYFEEENYTYYELLYNGEKVASIGIEGEKSDVNNDKEVVMMIVEDEQLSTLIINDKTCDMNMDDMKKNLGTPDKQSVDEWKALMEYNTDNVNLTIIFNDNYAHEITFVKKGE